MKLYKSIKKKKFLIIAITTIALIAISIGVPLAIQNNNVNETKIKNSWNKRLPKVFYETDKLNYYTTNVQESKGYISEHIPKESKIPVPKSVKDIVKIDNIKYVPLKQKIIDKDFSSKSFFTKRSNTKNITSDKKEALGYKKGVEEIKPKIKDIEIKTLKGGDIYDESKWSWKKTQTGVPGYKQITYKNTKIKGERILSQNAIGEYDPSLWYWAKFSWINTNRNSLFFGIDLGKGSSTLSFGSYPEAKEKAAILDALNKVEKIKFNLNENKIIFNNVLIDSNLPLLDFDHNEYEKIMKSDINKAKVFDIIVNEIKKNEKFSKIKENEIFSKYFVFRATYASIEISSYDVVAKTQPTGAPKTFDLKKDFVIGEITGHYYRDEKPDKYVAMYDGVKIPHLFKWVSYKEGKAGKPPTGVHEFFKNKKPNDYDPGQKYLKAQEPKVLDLQELINKNKLGDKINIDNKDFVIKEKHFYKLNKKHKNNKFYAKGVAKNEYVTNHKEANGYKPAKAIAKPAIMRNITKGKTIYIDGNKYIFG